MFDFLGQPDFYICFLPAIVISLTMHEFSHAWLATRLGDPTPKATGRLSFNPLRHIDPFGFIAMIFVRFGWAKPVQVNPLYFKKPRKGMMFTALAGPIMNLMLCVISSLLMFFCTVFLVRYHLWAIYLNTFFYYMVAMNAALAIFNLIPIHPLDGSRVVSYFFPRYAEFMRAYGEYVQLGFILLLILPGFLPIPDIIGTVIGGFQRLVINLLQNLWILLFGFLL